MATPHVAGLTLCLQALEKFDSARALKRRILELGTAENRRVLSRGQGFQCLALWVPKDTSSPKLRIFNGVGSGKHATNNVDVGDEVEEGVEVGDEPKEEPEPGPSCEHGVQGPRGPIAKTKTKKVKKGTWKKGN
ncbi:hypothetical protein CDD83_1372 [Cordyceps sp. RAO-2017]|nr:hypothetical protein CDD83_1372 [Cordyceps sp. RAO-2017]